MTTQTKRQPSTAEANDFRLLLDRIHKAPLDNNGAAFVRRALEKSGLLRHLDAEALLSIALVAQQHGLLEQSLTVYEAAHERFPENSDAWTQHLELLLLLGRREKAVSVRARAGRHIPAERLQRIAASEAKEVSQHTDVTRPFEELRRDEEHIRLFMRIFRGREDAFARQWVNRNEEKQGYVPVRRPLQAADVREHLDGRRTYGIYLLDERSMVRLGVVDVDLASGLRSAEARKKHRAAIRREALYLHKRIAALAREAGLCCLAEISGGKGYHFWFPVREPVPAAAMRKALTVLVGKLDEDVECFSLEIFPKQDKRTGKGFGNLVKLPLGIHRGTGKPSSFVLAADRSRASQFDLLASLSPSSAEAITGLAAQQHNAEVLIHPRHASWAEEYPELAVLESRCAPLGQLIATARSGRELSLREEKVLLSTIGQLPRAGLLLHHLFSLQPEYNRPLLDYKLSRVRGTPLGCKRIHSLLERGGELECRFEDKGYPHPLRHLDEYRDREPEPKSERVVNLQDALEQLKAAIRQVERFM